MDCHLRKSSINIAFFFFRSPWRAISHSAFKVSLLAGWQSSQSKCHHLDLEPCALTITRAHRVSHLGKLMSW